MKQPSAAQPAAAGKLQLGGFVLDVAGSELLTRDGQLAGLRRQALEVLLVLGRRAGQVVGKDELINRVWPDVVVGEGSLTQAIADVRRALGDSEHRLVRNVARRGYTLVPDTTPAGAPALSLAVLPFDIEGDAEAADWLAESLHGDLITQMSRYYGVTVIARDTVATCKGLAVDPRQVARELRVRHVLRGSLHLEGDRIRLGMVLVDGGSGAHCWDERFVIERPRLPQALTEMAVQIVRVLHPELVRSTVAQRAALSPSEVTADDLAMRAHALWYRGLHAENIVEALKLLERAVALDPDSVRGWGGLVFMNLHGVLNDWLPDRGAALGRIHEAAAQLERLESEGHYTFQARVIQCYLRQDWAAMIRVTTTWFGVSGHPAALGARGMAWLLSGRPDDAVADLQQALRLSPRETIRAEWQYRLAMAHFAAGRYELACDWSLTAVATTPSLRWPPVHAAAMWRLGQAAEARQAWADHMVRHPGYTSAQIVQRLPGGRAPPFAEALERLVDSLRRSGMR